MAGLSHKLTLHFLLPESLRRKILSEVISSVLAATVTPFTDQAYLGLCNPHIAELSSSRADADSRSGHLPEMQALFVLLPRSVRVCVTEAFVFGSRNIAPKILRVHNLKSSSDLPADCRVATLVLSTSLSILLLRIQA